MADPLKGTDDEDERVDPLESLVAETLKAETLPNDRAFRRTLRQQQDAKYDRSFKSIQTRNPEAFKDWERNTGAQDRALLTLRFLESGARRRYLDSEDKDREEIIDTLIEQEALERAGAPRGKDKGAHKAKLASIRAELKTASLGLSQLAEFQADPAEEEFIAKSVKRLKEEQATRDAYKGTLGQTRLDITRGFWSDLGGLVAFAGDTIDLAGNLGRAKRKKRTVIEGGKAVEKEFLSIGVAEVTDDEKNFLDRLGSRIQAFGSSIAREAEAERQFYSNDYIKDSQKELDGLVEKGDWVGVIGHVATDPELALSLGTSTVGQLVGSGGVAGGVRVAIARGAAKKAAAAAAKEAAEKGATTAVQATAGNLASSAVKSAAAKQATTIGSVAAGGSQAEATGRSVADRWAELTPERQSAMPLFREVHHLIEATGRTPSHAEVAEVVGKELASRTTGAMTPVNIAALYLGFGAEKMLSRAAGSEAVAAMMPKGWLPAATYGATREGTVNAAQGALDSAVADATLATGDPLRLDAADAGRASGNAALEAVLGAPLGAVAGGTAKKRDPLGSATPAPERTPTPTPTPTTPAERAASLGAVTGSDTPVAARGEPTPDNPADAEPPVLSAPHRAAAAADATATADRTRIAREVAAALGRAPTARTQDALATYARNAGIETVEPREVAPAERAALDVDQAVLEANASDSVSDSPAVRAAFIARRDTLHYTDAELRAAAEKVTAARRAYGEAAQVEDAAAELQELWDSPEAADAVRQALAEEDPTIAAAAVLPPDIIKKIDEQSLEAVRQSPELSLVAKQLDKIAESIARYAKANGVAVNEVQSAPARKRAAAKTKPAKATPATARSKKVLTNSAGRTPKGAAPRESAAALKRRVKQDAPALMSKKFGDDAEVKSGLEALLEQQGKQWVPTGKSRNSKWGRAVREARAAGTEATPLQKAVLDYNDNFLTPEQRFTTPRKGNQLRGTDLDAHVSQGGLSAVIAQAADDFSRLGVELRQYDTEADVPDGIKGDSTGFQALYTKNEAGEPVVVLVRNRLADKTAARRAIEHELVGHHTLEELYGEKGAADLLLRVYRGARGDRRLAAMLREVESTYPDSEGFTVEDRLREVVANIVHDARPPSGGYKGVLEAMRQTLRDSGFSSASRVTYPELQALMRQSYEWARDENAPRPTDISGYATENQKVHVHSGEEVLAMSATLERETFWLDRLAPVQGMLESMGATWGEASQLLRSMESRKARYMHGVMRDGYIAPLRDALDNLGTKHSMTRDQIYKAANDVLQARHAVENNTWQWLTTAPLKDKQDTEQRAGIINRALQRTISPAEARRDLDRLVTDSTVVQGNERETAKGSGITDAEAAGLLSRVDSGLLADLDALNAEDGAIGRLRAKTLEYNLQSGWYSDVLTQMAGYEHYVPRKGGDRHVGVRLPWTGDTSTNQTQKQTRGRGSLAEHTVTQLMTEGMDAAGRVPDMEFKRALGALVRDRDPRGKWAQVKRVKQTTYADGKFHYPEKPTKFDLDALWYVGDDGATYHLNIKDEAVARALANASKLEPTDRAMINRVGMVTRTYGRALTTWSPQFMATAALRDLQQAFVVGGTERGKFDAARGAKVAKDMAKVITTDANVRSFFYTSDGGREALIDAWRRHPDPANRTQKYLIEYHEQGGLIDFASSVDPNNLTRGRLADRRADPLAGRSERAATSALAALGTVGDAATRVATHLDNAHRLALYMALRDMGVPKAEASLRARNVMDYNQRSGFVDTSTGKWVQALYAFLQPNLTGLHATMTRRLWRDGEPPIETVEVAPGRFERRLSKDWWSKVNRPMVGIYFGAGVAHVALASMLMGTDPETGEDNARKQAIGTWFRNTVIPSGENPIIAPQQYGVQQLIQGLGTAFALYTHGYAEEREIVEEYLNTVSANLIPVGRFSVEEGQAIGMTLMAGITPSVLTAPMQLAMNTNAFGRPITNDRRSADQFRSDSGFSTTAQEWHDLALAVREGTGNRIDFAPEQYRHVLAGIGPLTSVDRFFRMGQGLAGDMAVTDAVGIGRRDFSADSFESRMSQDHTNRVFGPIKKLYNRARELDRLADPSLRGNQQGRKGEYERAFLEANPGVDDMVKAERVFQQAMGELSKQVTVARQAGDAQTVRDLMEARRRASWQWYQAMIGENPEYLRRLRSAR